MTDSTASYVADLSNIRPAEEPTGMDRALGLMHDHQTALILLSVAGLIVGVWFIWRRNRVVLAMFAKDAAAKLDRAAVSPRVFFFNRHSDGFAACRHFVCDNDRRHRQQILMVAEPRSQG